MKSWMVLILIALLIIVSGAAGYFMHQPEQVTTPADIIIKPDLSLLTRIDSFKVITIVHLHFIDSLKKELAKTKIKNEKVITNIDTLPAPELFRKIADYYNKQ